jgi:hypothetical protein
VIEREARITRKGTVRCTWVDCSEWFGELWCTSDNAGVLLQEGWEPDQRSGAFLITPDNHKLLLQGKPLSELNRAPVDRAATDVFGLPLRDGSRIRKEEGKTLRLYVTRFPILVICPQHRTILQRIDARARLRALDVECRWRPGPPQLIAVPRNL